MTSASCGARVPTRGTRTGTLNGADPAWYYQPGGGPLPDVAVYPLTSLTSLLGPVIAVTATSGRALKERSWEGKALELKEDDSWVLALDFGNGVLGSVHANFLSRKFNTPAGGDLRVDGRDPARRVDQPRGAARGQPGPRPHGRRDGGWTRPALPAPANDHKPTVRDLLHTVRRRARRANRPRSAGCTPPMSST